MSSSREKKISLEGFLSNVRAGRSYLLVARRLSIIINFEQCWSREHAEELTEIWRKEYSTERLTYEIYFTAYYLTGTGEGTEIQSIEKPQMTKRR